MAAPTKYNPADILVELMGVPIQGFASGTFVKVGKVTDRWSEQVGALGDVVRIRSNDDRGRIEITLMDDCPSNTMLESVATDDENGAEVVGVSQVKHVTGRGLAFGEHSWVIKKPDMEFASGEAKTRTWVIIVAKMFYDASGYGAAPAVV